MHLLIAGQLQNRETAETSAVKSCDVLAVSWSLVKSFEASIVEFLKSAVSPMETGFA